MAAVIAVENGRRCKRLIMCVLVMSVSLLVGTLSCPTSVCSCSARGAVVCSNKRLERIPFFGSHTDEANRRIYEEIDLSRNDIFAVPPHAFDSVRTRSLLLDRNPLIGISPRAFAGLEDVLQRIDLSSCDLRVIHWSVFRHLRQLREVSLARNALFAVPRGLLEGLDNIQNLSLTSNRLMVVRTSLLSGLKSLQQLDLSGNAITTIEPGSFEDCRQLTQLNLANNKLSTFDGNSLRGLENLQQLSLDGNEFVGEIPAEVLFSLRSLRFLYLSQNNLTVLGTRQFSASPRLEEISLASNRIDVIAPDAFHGLTRLRSVRFDDNRLSTIDGCLMAGLLQLDTLVQVSLAGNPLHCTCDRIWWLRSVMPSKASLVTGECQEGSSDSARGLALEQFYNMTSCGASDGRGLTQPEEFATRCVS